MRTVKYRWKKQEGCNPEHAKMTPKEQIDVSED